MKVNHVADNFSNSEALIKLNQEVGNIIIKTSEIDKYLAQLIKEMLGKLDKKTLIKKLGVDSMKFNKKIDMLKRLLDKKNNKVIDNLRELRDIRNSFAHEPCMTNKEGDFFLLEYKGHINPEMREKHGWGVVIDEEELKRIDKLIAKITNDIIVKIQKKLIEKS